MHKDTIVSFAQSVVLSFVFWTMLTAYFIANREGLGFVLTLASVGFAQVSSYLNCWYLETPEASSARETLGFVVIFTTVMAYVLAMFAAIRVFYV